MKRKLIYPFLYVTLLSLCFSCNNDEKVQLNDLAFDDNVYTVTESHVKAIPVEGNGDYTCMSENPEIAVAEYNEETGLINFTGIKVGSTTIKVKDNLANQTVDLKIVVTDQCMTFKLYPNSTKIEVEIENAEDKKKIEENIQALLWLQEPAIFYLMRDSEQKVYFYKSYDTDEPSYSVERGRYEFSATTDDAGFIIPWLGLTKFTNDGNGLESVFRMSGIEQHLKAIATFFYFDWEELAGSKASVALVNITLTEDLTDKYKADYPELQKAVVTLQTTLSANDITADIFR